MDSSDLKEFIPEFLKAAREHIVLLRNGVIALAANPFDSNLVNDLHIHAHSLKGECNSMGFKKTGELARLLEFYFKTMQSGEKSLTPDGGQLLIGLLDEIEKSLQNIQNNGNELDLTRQFSEFSEKTGIA